MFSTSNIKVENMTDDCSNYDEPGGCSNVDGALSVANFVEVILKTEDCTSSSSEEKPDQTFDAAGSHEVRFFSVPFDILGKLRYLIYTWLLCKTFLR